MILITYNIYDGFHKIHGAGDILAEDINTALTELDRMKDVLLDDNKTVADVRVTELR